MQKRLQPLITILLLACLPALSLHAQSPAWDECPWSTTPCCMGGVGDINGDGTDADPIDLAFLVDYLFVTGADPICDAEADLNGDGIPADPLDLGLLVDLLFAGGQPLGPCP